MIVPKQKPIDETPKEEVGVKVNLELGPNKYQTEQEVIAGNALEDLYHAVASIIKDIPQNPDKPDGPKLFKTVKWNMGQLNRLRNSKHNEEYAMAFPICLLHFINVYWNLGFNKIGQAYAQMRICFVLNRLNTNDDEYQTEGVRVFKRIIEAINDNMADKITPLTTRFQLSYFDQVESFDKGVQQYWITYEVRCNDYSTYRYKNYIPAYLVAPPFTNFDDMDKDKNTDDKTKVDRPIEDAVDLVDKVETNTPTINT